MSHSTRGVTAAAVAPTPALLPPRRFKATREGGELEIRVPWFNVGVDRLLTTFFSTVLGAFFFVQPMVWWITGRSGPGELQRLAPTMLAGLACTYYALACFINRATLCIDDERLEVRHGPLPWFGNRELLVAELQGFEARRSRSRRSGIVSTWLEVHLTDGTAKKLLGGLAKHDEARYLEQELAPFVHAGA